MKISNVKNSFSNKSFKNGSYSAGLTVIVLAILIVVNLVVGALPAHLTQYDMSPSLIYSIGEKTEDILDSLDKDVKITVVAEDNAIDDRIRNFLEKYTGLSSHLSIEYIDPVIHPSALEEFGVEENSIVVSCEETGREDSFTFADVIVKEVNYQYLYTYGQYVEEETEFDGEGQLTGAIALVTSDKTNLMYQLTGHEETALSETVVSQLKKSTIEVKDLNLLTESKIPEDANAIMIYNPTKDITPEEADLFLDYMEKGGKLFIVAAYNGIEFVNLEKVLNNYGVDLKPNNYLADTRSGNYWMSAQTSSQAYYYLIPSIVDKEVVFTSLPGNATILTAVSQPLLTIDDMRSSVTRTNLFTTKEGAIMINDENEQVEGTYPIAAAISENVDGKESRMVVIGTDLVNSDIISNYAMAANLSAFTDCAAYLFDELENISIRAKSLSISYNTPTNGNMWNILFVGVIPAAALGLGFAVWFKRRKK